MILIRAYVKTNDDKLDFETNYKNNATKIDKVLYKEVVFIQKKTYNEFKNLIDGETIRWSDVKYIQYENFYELLLEG